jgi:hypothetical protein
VPGQGVTGTDYDKHGGIATVDMTRESKPMGSGPARGWTAKSGSISFSRTVLFAGGGVVEMEMQPGPAVGPVHISGTWNAEQPCTVT